MKLGYVFTCFRCDDSRSAVRFRGHKLGDGECRRSHPQAFDKLRRGAALEAATALAIKSNLTGYYISCRKQNSPKSLRLAALHRRFK